MLWNNVEQFKISIMRDIGVQWEPVDDLQNSNDTINKTNRPSILYKEMATLRGDTWSLKLSLADSMQCSNNLQMVLSNTIEEKYELIEEIHCLHKLNKKLQSELCHEREKLQTERRNLLNEMYELKDELNRKHNSMAVMNNQSIELKKSLYKAEETIHRLANMFLKLRSIKQCSGNVPLTQ